MLRRQLVGRYAPPVPQSGPRGQTFETIAMVGATALIRVLVAIVRDGDVPHFRVHPAMQDAAIGDGTTPNAGTHREIQQTVQADTGTPACLAKGGGIDIGVETHRETKSFYQMAHDVDICPTRFWRGGNVAVGRGGLFQIHRSEAAYTNGGKCAVLSGGILKEAANLGQRNLRRVGIDANLCTDVVWMGTDGTDEFGPTRFNGAKEGAHGVLPRGG